MSFLASVPSILYSTVHGGDLRFAYLHPSFALGCCEAVDSTAGILDCTHARGFLCLCAHVCTSRCGMTYTSPKFPFLEFGGVASCSRSRITLPVDGTRTLRPPSIPSPLLPLHRPTLFQSFLPNFYVAGVFVLNFSCHDFGPGFIARKR